MESFMALEDMEFGPISRGMSLRAKAYVTCFHIAIFSQEHKLLRKQMDLHRSNIFHI